MTFEWPHFVWKWPDTWTSQLTAWLLPRFLRHGLRRLKPGRFRDLCWDDLEWSDVLNGASSPILTTTPTRLRTRSISGADFAFTIARR